MMDSVGSASTNPSPTSASACPGLGRRNLLGLRDSRAALEPLLPLVWPMHLRCHVWCHPNGLCWSLPLEPRRRTAFIEEGRKGLVLTQQLRNKIHEAAVSPHNRSTATTWSFDPTPETSRLSGRWTCLIHKFRLRRENTLVSRSTFAALTVSHSIRRRVAVQPVLARPMATSRSG
jgi:hypothetical protein